MTDDVEPRLRDHLEHRADRVHVAADLDDVHRRIGDRQRRRTRALGATLAVALVAGPVLGFALARSTEPDRDTVSATGGDLASGGAGGGGSVEGGEVIGAYVDYLGPALELVGERTTAEGIRLVTRVGTPYEGSAEDPCLPDAIVRVGVTDGDLVGVATIESRPTTALFAPTGGAEGRPLWVLVVRTSGGEVTARFPNGTTDTTAAGLDGIAVLAAYAGDGRAAYDLMADQIEVEEDGKEVRIARAAALAVVPKCVEPTPPDLATTMPAPGEPPADEEAARAAVEELVLTAMHGAPDEGGKALRERPNVWWEAQQRFREEHPDYYEWSLEVYSVLHEVVFTAPDRATFRYSLVSDNPSIPAPGERIGEAVLLDGSWKISIETACGNLSLAAVQCDYSIEG